MRNFANNLLAIAGLALLAIGGAEAQHNAFVDLALYRPSTGQFFIRSSLNGSITAIQFGAPGDRGLLCKFGDTLSGGDNLLLRRNGVWFVNFAADGATVDDSIANGAAADQPLCGNFFPFGGGAQMVLFRNGLWFLNGTPAFSFGTAGDVAVNIGAMGFGNASVNRSNVVYGVYRAGTWHLDEIGSGTPTRILSFGGLSQDVPLLIPGWDGFVQYSLAIYRDGTWYIRPNVDSSSIVTVQFGAIGDIPLVRHAH